MAKNPLRDAGTGRAPRPPVQLGIAGVTIKKPKLGPPPAFGRDGNPGRSPPSSRKPR